MGKLHYVNRKIDSLKLSQVVVKDLLKRIPPGSGHKAALRDPSIDLDISGKSLTDDTFQEIVDALTRVISYSDDNGRIAKLEELCLKGNQLTTRSLGLLAQVIRRSNQDIRDLDISDNLVVVSTRQDADNWETFLAAFDSCCVLRRIDLSSNALGSKAFEILARVYIRGGPSILCISNTPCAVEPARPLTNSISSTQDSNITGITDKSKETMLATRHIFYSPSEYHSGSIAGTKGRRSSLRGSLSSHEKKSAKHRSSIQSIYATEIGLHSVPYLVFSNTKVDDTAAMYLSYVIANHGLLEHLLPLVPPARAGPPTQQLEIYDSIPWCRGIIHHPNSDIGAAGARVIELAEYTRGGSDIMPMDDLQDQSQTPGSSHGSPNWHPEGLPNPISRRKSTGLVAQPRKQSTDSATSRSQVTPTPKVGELDRARSRIQGDTLRDKGPQCNDLWFASLRMLSYARVLLLLLLPRSEPTMKQEPDERELPKSFEEQCSLQEFPRLPSSNYASRMLARRSSPMRPLAPGNPNAPVVPRLPHQRKGSLLSASPTLPPIDTSVYTPASRPPIATREPTLHNGSPKGAFHGQLLGGLSPETWADIIGRAAEAEDLLCHDQKCAVIRWASDRETLTREMETLGKPESAQVWRVLEGMGCLAYQSD